MLCKEMLGVMTDYLDGVLDDSLCAAIERHMHDCGDCQLVVDTVRKTISLYRAYGHEEIPPDAKDRLYAVLHLEHGLETGS